MLSDIIYGVDLESITESLYLEIPLTESRVSYNIIVNPENCNYIIRKTVILNKPGYSKDNIRVLKDNGCKIISRVYIDDGDILFRPYLIRYSSRVMWNGGIEEIPESWSYYDGILHFPKISGKLWVGEKGEHDYLGFLAHQVGVHVFPGPYQDLDLVKIGKGRW